MNKRTLPVPPVGSNGPLTPSEGEREKTANGGTGKMLPL
jgi:hypothetical protein